MLISGKSSAFLDQKKHFFKGAQSVRSNYIFFAQVAWKGSLVDGLAGWNKRGTLTYVSADQLFSSLCSNIFSDVVTSPLGGHFGEKCVITCLIFWSQPTLPGELHSLGGTPAVWLPICSVGVLCLRCEAGQVFRLDVLWSAVQVGVVFPMPSGKRVFALPAHCLAVQLKWVPHLHVHCE